MEHVDVPQRRARLARRHHLATADDDVVRVAGDLCGLHSSDAQTVMLSARARVGGLAVADVERALYDDRSLARILAMRRTMFVVPTDDVALLHAASTRAQAATQHRRLVTMLEQGGDLDTGTDVAAWLDRVCRDTLAALHARGEATATELTQDVPDLGRRITVAPDRRWGGQIGVSTRVLFLLATEGRIVRGRPRGTWLSTQYRWAPVDTWFDGRVDVDALPADQARAALAQRWLHTFGPATVDDLQWWTGWTKTATRQALATIDPVEVDLHGQPGIMLRDDLDTVDAPAPWVALLPGLDPTVMGWKDRDFFLDPDLRRHLFDRNGNAGPTVWVDGRVVGGWAQRPDGEVVVRWLVDVGTDGVTRVEAEAAALADWLGDVRVVPRFRTPLEKDLSA